MPQKNKLIFNFISENIILNEKNGKIDKIENIQDLYFYLQKLNLSEFSDLFFIIGPGKYTASRKFLAICKAILIFAPHLNLYCFDILLDFLPLLNLTKILFYFSESFFWIKTDESFIIKPKNFHEEILQNSNSYFGNLSFNNSEHNSCLTNDFLPYLNQLKLKSNKIYNDKYSELEKK